MATISPTRHWDRVEQPILDALAAGDGSAMNARQLQTATGIERRELMRSLRSLKEAGFIAAVLVMAAEAEDPLDADGIRLLPKGLEHTGQWPSQDWSAVLLAALDNAIREEPDPNERTKLSAVRAGVKAGAGMTLNAVIANAVGAIRGTSASRRLAAST